MDIIWKNWSGDEEEEQEGEALGMESVEGMKAKDVGFMHVTLRYMTGIYRHMRDEHAWDIEYWRPPHVVNN